MSHRYFPHTEEDKKVMLEKCGVESIEALFADIPGQLRLKRPYALGKQMSEVEVRAFFKRLADNCSSLACFAGNGHYDRYTPAVVSAMTARSEFLTSYTPYQPEISQGTLQYIFEYQTMMARLTGMEISNASLYDGATATAEAMMLASGHSRRRPRVAYSATLNPAVEETIATYARYHGIDIVRVPEENGVTSITALKELLSAGNIGGVIMPQPNKYGIIEDFTGLADIVHEAGALLIINSIAIDLATLRSPGEWGADIAVGDAQSLGIPLNFGGPYLGYIASSKSLMRKLPGRIVGATVDSDGKRTFVLTLQAREQHIRREKATSNICSNQGLMALFVTIYMSLMGDEGLHKVNSISAAGAHYLAKELEMTGKMSLTYPGRPFLNEFEMTTRIDTRRIIDVLADAGILAGVATAPDRLLIAVTEMRSPDEINRYIETVKAL
ncbi:MAG: aminomethyl-transferring glycine dehydrogenase subunit GcvPA [Muribaculaceae bacterium]|nr:aminomethyl-transferring glycine dehydrogenase subunit GcvPA [Muribaculaceae bacterium]